MKRIIFFAAIIFALGSCGRDDSHDLKTGKEHKYINVTAVRYDYTAFPEFSTLTYECPEAVSASSNQAWLKATKVKEGEFRLDVSVNQTRQTRNAKLTLRTAGGSTTTIPVTQTGIVMDIVDVTPGITPGSVAGGIVRMENTGGTLEFEIACPIVYEATGSADWITDGLTVEGAKVTLTLGSHTLFPRIGTIDIKVPELQLTSQVTIEQLGDLSGTALAEKFVGEEGTASEWYFNPAADNGKSFNDSWVYLPSGASPRYHHTWLRVGRVMTTGQNLSWYIDGTSQGSSTGLRNILLLRFWEFSTARHNTTAYNMTITQGERDDQVVFTLDNTLSTSTSVGTEYYLNDVWTLRNAGSRAIVTNLVGNTAGATKTYDIINADNIDSPTVMTLKDTTDPQNWFTVSRAAVTLNSY